jgi:glycosyltransferase involved in cell wall biosynthesis
MAMGIPVIGSDIPGLRSIVRHDETGILVPVKDPEAIAGQLDRLLGDPALYQKISRNAAAYIRDNHSARAAAVKYGELYESLIMSGSREGGAR